MSSETWMQTFPSAPASSSAMFLAGISFPPTTASRPKARYASRLGASTYHLGVTPVPLNCDCVIKMSRTPSFVCVRRAEITEKCISLGSGKARRCVSSRTLNNFKSASTPLAVGLCTTCQLEETLPATNSALGPSKHFKTIPNALEQSRSCFSENACAPRASSSARVMWSTSKLPGGSSWPREILRRRCSSITEGMRARRARRGSASKGRPFSTRTSDTITPIFSSVSNNLVASNVSGQTVTASRTPAVGSADVFPGESVTMVLLSMVVLPSAAAFSRITLLTSSLSPTVTAA
mmetsp:Transcript_24019/g.63097  ORF Transcript_24019/g.63097 Transcript_24019/m.63097 type:complete len:293 (-) Transcript_24019:1403-2281(-)